jgi:YD repeat-containing protein
VRKFIFAIITLLGLSATAELSAQFLSADLQADDLRGNVAKVEYNYDLPGSSYAVPGFSVYKYDAQGRLCAFDDEVGSDFSIIRSGNKITQIQPYKGCDDDAVKYTYSGNLIAAATSANGEATTSIKFTYNQNGNLTRKVQTESGVREEWHEDCTCDRIKWTKTTTYDFTIVERDSKGNWTKRSVKRTSNDGTKTYTETRKITYR